MIELNKLAKILKCHPRTILRAITGEKNPYWVKGYNITLDPGNWFYGAGYIYIALDEKDELLKPDEAAKYLNINPRTFRYRKYEPTIKFGKIVRYSKNYLKQFLKLKDVL